jgi:hypothetical protein
MITLRTKAVEVMQPEAEAEASNNEDSIVFSTARDCRSFTNLGK